MNTEAAADKGRRRIALLLEYDGANFAGSQYQTNARTVQLVLEEAIERATVERSRVAFSGRTDSGVHARGQVASFLTTTRLETGVLRAALNAWLPEDVAVRAVVEAAVDFDVRRDARRRHYRYLIESRPTRSALDRGRAWQVAQYLDVEAMAKAAGGVIGRHDFAAFASRLEQAGASTVREVYGFEVSRQGPELRCDVIANAFLPHQVRRMVGALVEVGKGKLTPDEYVALLGAEAASPGPAAPPHGLYLMWVEYERELFPAGAC
jgi:tRNA pseudouridine38-40 synthase